MPSTYTTNNGLELMATGENAGTWGTKTNTSLDIVDRLTTGVGAISLSGTTFTLTTTDATLSDGHYRVLVFGGSPSGTNTVTITPNDQQKYFIVKNNSGQSVVMTQGSGGNVTIANGKSAIVYADGAGAGAAVVDVTATFDFQAASASLTAIAALATTDGNFIVGDGSTWVAESGSTARTSLGLGSIATQAANNVSISGGSITGITDLAVADGGTGVSTVPTNGQLLIGNGTGYTVAAITAGSNITVTNGSGSITIASTAGGATSIDGLSDAIANATSVGLGSGALTNDDGTTNYNTALGINSSATLTTGAFNTSVGYISYQNGNGFGNTAVGYQALNAATSSEGSVAVGQNALFSVTTPAGNVGVGQNAGTYITTGARNVAVGQYALQGQNATKLTGSNNIGLGFEAGFDVSTGTDNFFGGYRAGTNVTTGSNNVAIGNGALDAATTGGRNIAIGQDAMGLGVATNATGDNIAIGYQAGYDLTSGTDNIFIGELAGSNYTSASGNISVGNSSTVNWTGGAANTVIGSLAAGLGSNSTGENNTVIGAVAGYDIANGSENTFVGHASGFNVTSGGQNVHIGRLSGNTTTTGSNTICVGYDAEASSATVSNEITLGNSSITSFRVPGVGLQFDTTDGLIVPKTITAAGTTGAQTINKTAGSVNFAAAATSLVVTNSFVDANSVIIATVGSDDTTMKSVAAVAGAGSFTLYANAAATAETRVNWFVVN